MTAPVALVLFNRPGPTARVFAAIRAARPEKLFLIADGPRPGREDDAAACARAREVVAAVDWPCAVERDYSDVNFGCAGRVVSGLDRVFERFDEAIILEDDTVPDASFFPYASALLARYRDDPAVFFVSGRNDLGAWPAGGADYFFSRHGSVWGWATWRRAWRHYSYLLAPYRGRDAEARLRRWLPDRDHAEHQGWMLDRVAGRAIDTWDVQWTLTCMLEGAFAAVPRVNLVENVGFGAGATHTGHRGDVRAELRAGVLPSPLSHPAGQPARHVDDGFDRAAYLLRCLASYTDPRALFLWQRLLERHPELAPPGVNDGFRQMLAPLRAPREALAVLAHLRSALPVSSRLEHLLGELEWAARAC